MFSHPRSFLFSLFLFVGGVGGIFGAEPQVLDLPALKKLLLERNAEYRAKKNLKEISGNEFVSAKSQFFWPGVSIKLTTPFKSEWTPSFKSEIFTNGSLITTNSIYTGLSETTNFRPVGTISLEEKLPFDSTITAYLSSTLDLLAGPTNILTGGLSWKQPLVPFLRHSEIDFNRILTERELRSQNDSLSQKEKDLLNQLEGLYYDLALTRGSLRVSENKRTKSKQNLADTRKKFQAGLINEVDALRINLNDNVIQNAYDNFVQEEREKKLEILSLIRMDSTESIDIRTVDPMETVGASIKNEVAYDVEASINKSLSNEGPIRDKDFALWKEEEKFKKDKEKYGLTGDVNLGFSGDFAARNSYQFNLGLNLQTPVLDRGDFLRARTNHFLRRDTLKRDKEQLAINLRKDIVQKVSELTDIARQFAVAKENRDIASKIYAMDQRRFELGLITSDVLITTESDYFNRELDLVRQAVRWIKAGNYLEYRYHMVKKK